MAKVPLEPQQRLLFLSSALGKYLVVVGAVGKWESRALCGISKCGGKVRLCTLDFSTTRLFHSPRARAFSASDCEGCDACQGSQLRFPTDEWSSPRGWIGSSQVLGRRLGVTAARRPCPFNGQQEAEPTRGLLPPRG